MESGARAMVAGALALVGGNGGEGRWAEPRDQKKEQELATARAREKAEEARKVERVKKLLKKTLGTDERRAAPAPWMLTPHGAVRENIRRAGTVCALYTLFAEPFFVAFDVRPIGDAGERRTLGRCPPHVAAQFVGPGSAQAAVVRPAPRAAALPESWYLQVPLARTTQCSGSTAVRRRASLPSVSRRARHSLPERSCRLSTGTDGVAAHSAGFLHAGRRRAGARHGSLLCHRLLLVSCGRRSRQRTPAAARP